jgi:hypothetical protein
LNTPTQHSTPKGLYQYVGKDDTYELLGDCIGAGTDRGHDTKIYRNIHTGQLHSRFADDFENRLVRIGERVEFSYSEAPQPYNSGHQIEGVDRCHTVQEMIHSLLDAHPAVLKSGAAPLIEQARTAIFQAHQLIGLMDDTVVSSGEDDTDLLREALELFEYVTWHDGRYRQESSLKFQTPAQKLVSRLAERLGVVPYQSLKQE